MKATTHEFSGWQRGKAPVIVAEQPVGAISLAWLADKENQEQLLPAMIALSGERRQAALTVVHYAVYAVTNILIAPFVFDRCVLTLAPDQLGVVLDETSNVNALWVGQVELTEPEQPLAQLGALAMQLLAPVAVVSVSSARSVNGRSITLHSMPWHLAVAALNAPAATYRVLAGSRNCSWRPGIRPTNQRARCSPIPMRVRQ